MLIDVHAHPSLKSWVFDHDLTHDNPNPARDLNTLDAQVDLPGMMAGGVTAMVAAHYLIEKRFFDRWSAPLRLAAGVQQFIHHRKVVEDPSIKGKPFTQLLDIIQFFQKQIDIAAKKGFRTAVAKSYFELNLMLSQGKTVFLNSVEGSNCFNTLTTEHELTEAIRKLFELGVCQFTIAHLENSDIVPSAQGIPPGTKKTLGYKDWKPNPNAKLGPMGIQAVTLMLDLGIVIDLQHCTPATRAQIFELNSKRETPRPIVMSHTGLRSIAASGEMGRKNGTTNIYQVDLDNLPSDDEVKSIITSRGTIGLIWANYWINGTEEDDPFRIDNGIPDIIRTMKRIAALEREVNPSFDCDHISIGSDQDGFTQRPDDLYSPRCTNDLISAMEAAGFTSKQIEKISWRNYMRVLELGWGK